MRSHWPERGRRKNGKKEDEEGGGVNKEGRKEGRKTLCQTKKENALTLFLSSFLLEMEERKESDFIQRELKRKRWGLRGGRGVFVGEEEEKEEEERW